MLDSSIKSNCYKWWFSRLCGGNRQTKRNYSKTSFSIAVFCNVYISLCDAFSNNTHKPNSLTFGSTDQCSVAQCIIIRIDCFLNCSEAVPSMFCHFNCRNFFRLCDVIWCYRSSIITTIFSLRYFTRFFFARKLLLLCTAHNVDAQMLCV